MIEVALRSRCHYDRGGLVIEVALRSRCPCDRGGLVIEVALCCVVLVQRVI